MRNRQNPVRKASIDSSVSQVHLAKAKHSAVVEMMEGVVNTAAFAAKAGVNELIASEVDVNFMAKAHSDFVRKVLRLAGSYCRVAGMRSLSGYCIHKKKNQNPC